MEIEELAPCGAPEARATLGPFRLHDAADDWASVPPPDSVLDAALGLAIFDADGDGHLDLFVPGWDRDRLFLRSADGRLQEVGAQALPDLGGESTGASVYDVDGDGDLDLLVHRRGENALLLNDGDGSFSKADAPTLALTAAETRHVAWGDLDGDGLPELFEATSYPPFEDELSDPNRLLSLQAVDGDNFAFTDLSVQLDEKMARLAPSNAGGFVDLDGDGDQDLVIVNEKPQDGYYTVALLNEGGELAWDDGDCGILEPIKGMGLGVGDLNEDGLPDLAVTGWNENALLLSAPDGTWYDAALSWGLITDADRVVGWGVDLIDLDNDGDQDALIAYGADFDSHGDRADPLINPERQPLGLYINEGGHFVERSAEWGLVERGTHRGFVTADVDGDGYLDIAVVDITGQPRLHLSRCGEASFLKVELEGPPPNTFGVGARVQVEAEGRTWWREIEAGSRSIASSGPPIAHFGLGELERVDALEVRWPDGAVTRFEDLPTRARIRVRHPEAP